MRKLVVFLLTIFVFAGAAFAASDINAEWKKLCDALDKEKGISPETKQALKSFSEALVEQGKTESVNVNDKVQEWFAGKKRIEAADKLFGTKTKRGLLERLTLYGDFRYRFQVDSNRDSMEPAATHSHQDRAVQNVRLRIGFVLNIEEDLLEFGARLTTGDAADPVEENASFDNNFGKIDVNYDRIYLHYTPFSAARPYRLFGVADMKTDFYIGKFDHRWLFYGTNVNWYPAVQPTGLGAMFTFNNFGCGFIDEARLSLGFYQMTEENFNEDTTIFAAQIAGSKAFKMFGHDFKLTVATGVYDLNDKDADNNSSSILDHGGVSVQSGTNAAGTEFVSEFTILQNFIKLDFGGFEILGKKRPISLVLEHQYNMSANGDPSFPRHGSDDVDTGFTVMITMGELKKKGDWKVGYLYTTLERDSNLPGLVSTSLPYSTNCIGNIVWIDYNLFDKTSLKLWYGFGDQRIDDGTTTDGEDDHVNGRLRFEVNVKF